MPLHDAYICKFLVVWSVDFMGPFPPSFRCTYILIIIYYVSKWVEVVAIRANDAKTIIICVKSQIVHSYGVLRAIIMCLLDFISKKRPS